MFAVRQYFINNSPYKFYNYKYTDELSKLQKELNFLQSRIILRNILLVIAGFVVLTSSVEDFAVDWRDRFDVKFNTKAYGGLDDSSGEGNVSIDD